MKNYNILITSEHFIVNIWPTVFDYNKIQRLHLIDMFDFRKWANQLLNNDRKW